MMERATQSSKRIGFLPAPPITAARNTTTAIEVDMIGSSSRNISSSSSARGRLVSDQYEVSKDLSNELYRISEPKNFSRREAYQSILKLYHWSKTSTTSTTIRSRNKGHTPQQQLQPALQFLQGMVKLNALPYILQYIKRTAATQHHMTDNKYVCTAAEILIHCTDHNDNNNDDDNTTCANEEDGKQQQQQQQLRRKMAITKHQLAKTAIAAHCIPIVIAIIERTVRAVTEQHCCSGGTTSLRRSQHWETLEYCWTVVYTVTLQCPPPPHGEQEDGQTTTTHCDVRREGSDPKTSQLLAIMESCSTTVAMIRDLMLIKKEEKKKTTTMTNKPQEKYNDTIVTTVAASTTTTTKLQSLLMDKILRLVLHTSKNIARMNNHNNHNQREMDDHITGSNPILLMANDLEEDRTQLLVTNFFSSVRSSIYQNQQQS